LKPIISENCRFRYRELFEIGESSIIDDFCYVSTALKVGRYSHIAAGCTFGGGKDRTVSLGDFSSISSGVRIYCVSNDFVNDLVFINPLHDGSLNEKLIIGDVRIGNYTGIGTNTVILPDCIIPEGCVIGALSLVPSGSRLEEWSVYAGNPLRLVKKRNRENILRQIKILEERL